MIGTLRKHSQWLWAVIIVVVIISFVIFFSPDARLGRGAGEQDYGKLYGEPVKREALVQAYADARLGYFLSTGQWPDRDERARMFGFNLEGEARQRLLLNHQLKEHGIDVGEVAVAQEIKNIFTDPQTGAFNLQRYDSMLKQHFAPVGVSEANFERFLRNELGRQQLTRMFGLSGKLISERAADGFYRRENESALTEFVFLANSNNLAKVKLDEPLLRAYHTNNLATYRIPERVQACISEVEHELYKVAVPIVTRHNEVAPCQFELAPIFEDTDIAVDHNHLVMSILRKIAPRHGLQAIVHEKPFAGINGSGKHCNWSLSITSDNALDGTNLLKPGKTPHQNIRFLVFLAAVLKGVHKHAGLLRAGIAVSGNEHRLGANEAPPAIISAFLGSGLTQVVEDIAAGKTSPKNAEQAMLTLGVAKLPEVAQDNTDRNRTSPFAFTGSKFEFRAVGASQSIAFPVMLLQAAVAEAIGEIIEQLKAEIKTGKSTDDAALKVAAKAFKESAAVRFEGNNYSDEWVVEAKTRGLLNLRRTPEALAQLLTDDAKSLFKNTHILTAVELESRYHVRLERYVKDILIELHTIQQMIDTQVLPAAYAFLGQLAASAGQGAAAGINMQPIVDAANSVSKMVATLQKKRAELAKVITKAEHMHDDLGGQADYLTTTGCETMGEVRDAADAIELAIGDEFWPLPRYREMLFPV